MKKISRKQNQFYINRNARLKKKELLIATKRRNKKKRNKTPSHKKKVYLKNHSYRHELERKRSSIRKSYFKMLTFDEPQKTIKIDGQFGVEEESQIIGFYDIAEEIIDFNSSHLNIDLTNCSRMWPSGVTLLCSLLKWIELAQFVSNKKPERISSNSPKDNRVDEYLSHCGFYKYVGRKHSVNPNAFKKGEVVEIHRETKKANIETREIQIIDLLSKYSTLTDEQIEIVDCIIMTEIVNNITEHGVTCYDQGWWLLAQYHKKHGIISLNIADNGIGFRKNLTTGPQSKDVISKIKDQKANDHNFILYAFDESVSGAFNAATKDEGLIKKRYSVGERRGNGLNRIRKACNKTGINLSIMSHYGYVHFDSHDKVIHSGSRENRIFAGTMYQLIIPAKGGK